MIQSKIFLRLFVFCLLFVTTSFDYGHNYQQAKSCSLHIKLLNIPDNTYLYLSKGNDGATIDSILIMNGKGSYNVHLEHPTRFQIINYDFTNRKYESVKKIQYKFFWLENADIKMIGDFRNLRNAKIYGSISDSISNQYLTIRDEYSSIINNLRKTEKKVKDQSKIKKIKQQISYNKKKLKNEMISYFMQNSNSLVVLPYLGEQCIYNNLSKGDILNIYNKLSSNLKRTKTAKEIKHFTTLPEIPKVGDKCIDFSQTSTNGKTVKLSNFYGRYILLDFWAANCYPCRIGNPKLVQLYNQYHPLGLEIIGVSQDTDKKEWIKAIKKDRLPWVNVSDLKGEFNEPSLLYGIVGIPTDIIINKKGVIIHKNVGIDNSLNETLKEIFDK
jgi:peroxiredoxin